MPISLSALNQLSLKAVPSVSEVTAWRGLREVLVEQEGTRPHHFGAF